MFNGLSQINSFTFGSLSVNKRSQINNNRFNKVSNYSLPKKSFLQSDTFISKTSFMGDKKLLPDFKSIIADNYNSNPDKIIEVISNLDINQCEFSKILLEITKDDNISDKFIKAITKDPRKSQEIVKTIVNKLGGSKQYVSWLIHPKGYVEAYKKFLTNVYEKANNIEELLALQPNWTLWALKNKYKEANPNSNFILGTVPNEFGGGDAFYQLLDTLKHYQGGRQEINSYTIEPLSNGLSDKKSFKITFNNKAYVLKIDNNPNHAFESEYNKENKTLKSDSVMINSVIDFYLNKHNCQNSPKFLFYDYYNNASLYEFSEGKVANDEDMHKIKQNLQDYYQLGIIYNDLQPSNFITNINGSFTAIDTGESVFIDSLRPGSPNLTYNLPNFSGQDYANILAGTLLAIL